MHVGMYTNASSYVCLRASVLRGGAWGWASQRIAELGSAMRIMMAYSDCGSKSAV